MERLIKSVQKFCEIIELAAAVLVSVGIVLSASAERYVSIPGISGKDIFYCNRYRVCRNALSSQFR